MTSEQQEAIEIADWLTSFFRNDFNAMLDSMESNALAEKNHVHRQAETDKK